MYSSTHSATYISIYIYSSPYLSNYVWARDTATSWNGGLPSSSLSLSLSLSSSLPISGSFSLSLPHLLFLSRSLARALAHALGLVTSRVLEDTIDTPTFSNGVLPSLFVSLSLSVFFSFCLWLSLTRRSCLALSLGARSRSCSKAHLHSCSRGHHWHPNLLEWCPAVILCHRLFRSLALPLSSLISPVAFSCARSRTCARPRH